MNITMTYGDMAVSLAIALMAPGIYLLPKIYRAAVDAIARRSEGSTKARAVQLETELARYKTELGDPTKHFGRALELLGIAIFTGILLIMFGILSTEAILVDLRENFPHFPLGAVAHPNLLINMVSESLPLVIFVVLIIMFRIDGNKFALHVRPEKNIARLEAQIKRLRDSLSAKAAAEN
jgi:hypothetical protein